MQRARRRCLIAVSGMDRGLYRPARSRYSADDTRPMSAGCMVESGGRGDRVNKLTCSNPGESIADAQRHPMTKASGACRAGEVVYHRVWWPRRPDEALYRCSAHGMGACVGGMRGMRGMRVRGHGL